MTPRRLLAKSYDRSVYPADVPDYALLTQHSRDVAAACAALARRAGRAALASTGLDSSRGEEFDRALRLNGWMQDLGKANSHFLAMVSDTPEIQQLVRHETLSGLLFWHEPALRAWLAPMGDALLPALWGAMGHHRKFDEYTAPEQVAALQLHVSHPDFAVILEEMGADLGLARPPRFERDLTYGRTRRDRANRAALDLLQGLRSDFQDEEAAFADELPRRFLALIKGFGIAADIAASALARRWVKASCYALGPFIDEQLRRGALTTADLSRLINVWAWQQHSQVSTVDESALPPGFGIRPFQTAVSSSTAYLTLAEAGCGSGKSLAAYLWARAWCERRASEGDFGFRLFVCLPTTGTTTEHFKDYALEAGICATLAHSRASVDLETLASTADQEDEEPRQGRGHERGQAACDALHAERQKIEALALWSTPLSVTTADTVLGLMVNARRALCALPAIVQSAIVFDEIHAFDEQLFGHLLVFLKNFPRLPVLLMTASLPEARRNAIAAVRPDLYVVPGPKDLEDALRYTLFEVSDETTVWTEIAACLADDGKVLWVRNRVDWANESYGRAVQRFPDVPVDVYHSRLRYLDRSRRHRRVIDRFKKVGSPALLIATQVVEMSLDLSADLLVTDEAPIPSLIQRLGRLNRRANPASSKPALICRVADNDARPYTVDVLNAVRNFIRALQQQGRSLSQRDLANQFSLSPEGKPFDFQAAEQNACFFGVPGSSGVWRTRPGTTRAEGYTVSVLLERDVADHARGSAGQPKSDWLRQHEVAVPLKDIALRWKRVAGLPVAPDEDVEYDYDDFTHEGTGARWREK